MPLALLEGLGLLVVENAAGEGAELEQSHEGPQQPWFGGLLTWGEAGCM